MTSDRARLVTVSASYGAGGSVVAPALAERLGVPFLQRATTSTGGTAAGGPEPCTERLTPDEADLTPAHRLLASLTQAMPAGPTQSPPSSRHQDEHLRRYCEEGIRRLADDGAGVILGRGAAVVLGKDARLPRAARRAARAARRAGRRDRGDRAWTRPAVTWTRPTGPAIAYVRRLYRADPADPRHYHLVIDSTAIPLDAVVEIILRALPPSRPRSSRRWQPRLPYCAGGGCAWLR